jgi:hypothetical protein
MNSKSLLTKFEESTAVEGKCPKCNSSNITLGKGNDDRCLCNACGNTGPCDLYRGDLATTVDADEEQVGSTLTRAPMDNEIVKTESKIMTQGNGTVVINGNLLELSIWLNTSPNTPRRKRVGFGVFTNKSSRNSFTRVNPKDNKDYDKSWEEEAMKIAVKRLKSKFDALDDELDKVYAEILGTPAHELEDK